MVAKRKQQYVKYRYFAAINRALVSYAGRLFLRAVMIGPI
jgi:hypothetical protein